MKPAAALRPLRVAALLTLVLLPGCKGKKEQPAPAKRSAAAKPTAKAPPRPVVSTDNAVGILLALDSGRIASGTAVRTLSQSDAVLEFVRVMLADHSETTRMLQSLLQASGHTPADNPTTQQMRLETQQFVTELLARDSGINNSYLAHEVQDHEQALMLLDTSFIPGVQDVTVKQTLEQLRPMLEAHIQQARRIQAARSAAAAAKAAQSTVGATPTPIPITTTNN